MITMKNFFSYLKARLNNCGKVISDIFFGMTAYDLELELRKESGGLNNLLMLMIFGDMAGLPLFPPYYSLRLLPYLIPKINRWKRNILRERDLTDVIATDL